MTEHSTRKKMSDSDIKSIRSIIRCTNWEYNPPLAAAGLSLSSLLVVIAGAIGNLPIPVLLGSITLGFGLVMAIHRRFWPNPSDLPNYYVAPPAALAYYNLSKETRDTLVAIAKTSQDGITIAHLETMLRQHENALTEDWKNQISEKQIKALQQTTYNPRLALS